MRQNTKLFLKNGFVILKIFNEKQIKNLKKLILKKINKYALNNLKIKDLKIYHKKINEQSHQKITNPLNRYIILDKVLVKHLLNNKNVRDIIDNYFFEKKVRFKLNPKFNKKSVLNASIFRIARPKKKNDVAKPHIDSDYAGKSNIKVLTFWIPIIGHTRNQSLAIYLNSHKYKHTIKVKKQKLTKVSREINPMYLKKFKKKRFLVSKGEAMIFNSNLIHGNSLI